MRDREKKFVRGRYIYIYIYIRKLIYT